MGRSPKSSSHRHSASNQKSRKRRDSSSSGSDDDRQRYERRNRDQSREDNRSRSSKRTKMISHENAHFLSLDVRVKQEPVTDDDSQRNRRPQKPYDRRNQREKDEKSYSWGKSNDKEKTKEAPIEKEKQNFGLSGALLKDTNTYKGVVIKYSEPLEARKPKRRWRFYVFKGDQVNLKREFSSMKGLCFFLGITNVSNSSSISIFNWP